MKRRFNFTGRKRITRDRVAIEIYGDGDNEYFDAGIDLKDLDLPGDGLVIIEAYHKTERERYGFGTVKNLSAPRDTGLSSVARTSRIKFAVKVVDRMSGRLLASAWNISPLNQDGETASGRKGILNVRYDHDLQKEAWKIKIDHSSGPELRLNERIPSIERTAKNDSNFHCLLYPSVVREILNRLCFVYGVENVEDPELGWRRDWLTFATQISGEDPPPVLDPFDGTFEPDEVISWIEQVVEAFCAINSDKWKDFIRMRR